MPEKIKAVVIDDVAFCRSFLTDMLEDRGYEVTEFSAAVDFVGHCRANGQCPVEKACVDLLLTDNQMPHLTGLELLEAQAVKGCKLSKETRAIISGSWSVKDLKKAASLDCKTFAKPHLDGLQNWLDRIEAAFQNQQTV